MIFTKVERGWYATDDGQYAVVIDGYDRHGSVESQDQDGIRGNEWALVHDSRGRLRIDHNAGENIDWFDTKGKAVAYAIRRFANLTVINERNGGST